MEANLGTRVRMDHLELCCQVNPKGCAHPIGARDTCGISLGKCIDHLISDGRADGTGVGYVDHLCPPHQIEYTQMRSLQLQERKRQTT